MTEVGEGVDLMLALYQDAKCPMCGSKHASPTNEKSAETGWRRGSSLKPRDGVEKAGDQLHHAVALCAFVYEKPRESGAWNDFLPELNRELAKTEFNPNEKLNCIALPGPSGSEVHSYTRFWQSLDRGLPRQMHIGRHESPALSASKAMTLYMLRYAVEGARFCTSPNPEKAPQSLLELARHAEDLAWTRTLRYVKPFQLHARRFEFACQQYRATNAATEIVGKKRSSVEGHAGTWGASKAGGDLPAALVDHWRSDTSFVREGNPFARADDLDAPAAGQG